MTDTARVIPTRGDFVAARAASAASFSVIFAVTAWRARLKLLAVGGDELARRPEPGDVAVDLRRD